jgi:hypothetical protein
MPEFPVTSEVKALDSQAEFLWSGRCRKLNAQGTRRLDAFNNKHLALRKETATAASQN